MKQTMSSKKYLKALSEGFREGIDPNTGQLVIEGDLAKDISDALQKISEGMPR